MRCLKQSGFTLIEVIAAIAVFTAVTGIVVFSIDDFRGGSLLESELAKTQLLIERAQSEARAASDLSGSSRRGVYVEYNSGYTGRIVLFLDQDTGTQNQYDGGDIVLDEIRLTGDVSVSQICGNNIGQSQTCSTVLPAHIVYSRATVGATLSLGSTVYEELDISLHGESSSQTEVIELYINGSVRQK